MMMFFSNLWRVFRKRTFINVLFWIFHFRFEKNDSLHFTSIPFPWRPPCLLLRGYAAVVVWNGMYCEHIWCGGVGRVGVGRVGVGRVGVGDRIVVVLSWYCRGIVVVLFVYIFGKWEKWGEKNLPWLTWSWSLVWSCVLSCARFSCTPRRGRIRIRVRSMFHRLRSPSSRSHRRSCRHYIRRCSERGRGGGLLLLLLRLALSSPP